MNVCSKVKNEKVFDWQSIVDEMAVSFRLTENEAQSLFKSRIARLIGALPFLASCEEADRTARSHVAIYLIAANGSKKEFCHNGNDNRDVMDRLSEISHFKGGDEKIIEKGMKLLALNMVHGYKRDVEYDVSINKYNPVATGDWDYKRLVDSLTEDVKSINFKKMDEYGTCESVVFNAWHYL